MTHKTRVMSLLFVVFCLATAAKSFAADGDLDSSFDTDGVVLTDNGQPSEVVIDLVAQPDGKIIALGNSLDGNGNNRRIIIVRYNADGSIDSSFGASGKVTITAFNTGKMVLQPDGKIVFVAQIESNATDFYIARLNSNGSFDTTFNSTGVVNVDLRGTADSARAVKIQPDGKIVVGGVSSRVSPATGFDQALVRLNTDGSLDTTFDGDGKALEPASTDRNDNLTDLALQRDGKIVTAGMSTITDGQTYTFLVVRFNANGSLDTTFDGDGKVFTQIATGFASLGSVAVQCDGKIVVAASPVVSGLSKAALIRYNHNGSLDSTFANGGIMLSSFIGKAYDVTFQADNKIVVGARIGDIKQAFLAVGRFNLDGSPDGTFHGGGWNWLDGPFLSFSEGYAAAIQPDGRIVTGGYTTQGTNGSDFILARFNATSGPANCSDKVADFDGDGRSDYSLFRNGQWVVRPSNNIDTFYAVDFGLSSDKITPLDFDGDGITDISVFRDGTWYILRSQFGFVSIQFGAFGDTPLPADYDGDGKADLAVFRSGIWHIFGSQVGYYAFQFGVSIDRPVPADYDGDGKTDAAVFRDGNWHILRSQLGYTVVPFGFATDRPVVGDYDGDGRADEAVYRNGIWYVLGSTQGFSVVYFGLSTDTPIPADYDGDSKTDVAVWRDGTWYLQRSTLGYGSATLGVPGDRPIPSVYVPWGQQQPW